MRVRTLAFSVVLLLKVGAISVHAQSRWTKYDSLLFENLFLPNFSNLLMPKGYVEVIVSNSLSSANQGWTDDNKFDLNGRYTFNQTVAIVNIGTSSTNRFNAGVEMHYGIGYHDSDPGSSALDIFRSAPPGYVQKASALTSIGPRVKWRPVRSNQNFVYITTLQFGLPIDANSGNLLDTRTYWGNQFLYSFSAGKRFSFFVQDDIYLYFKRGLNSHNQYYQGLSFFSYWLISKHVYPFVSVGYGGAYGTDNAGDFKNFYHAIPGGAGLQYQASMRFTFNVYYTQYLWAKDLQYDMKTVNVGLRGVF